MNPHNTFIRRLKGKENAILPYLVQNILMQPMRNAAAKKGESRFQSLWAGQGVTRIAIDAGNRTCSETGGKTKEAGVALA